MMKMRRMRMERKKNRKVMMRGERRKGRRKGTCFPFYSK